MKAGFVAYGNYFYQWIEKSFQKKALVDGLSFPVIFRMFCVRLKVVFLDLLLAREDVLSKTSYEFIPFIEYSFGAVSRFEYFSTSVMGRHFSRAFHQMEENHSNCCYYHSQYFNVSSLSLLCYLRGHFPLLAKV